MASHRTKSLFVGSLALLLPALAFIVISIINLSDGEIALSTVAALLAVPTGWIGVVLLRRASRSRELDKDQESPKIVT